MGVLDNLLSGFPFKTAEQTKKEKQQFENRVLPFGDAQRQAALGVLGQLVQAKMTDAEKLFIFLAAKDPYTLAEDPAEGEQAARKFLKRQRMLSGADKLNVMALLQLDTALAALEKPEDYPTARQVQALAATLPPV